MAGVSAITLFSEGLWPLAGEVAVLQLVAANLSQGRPVRVGEVVAAQS
jgi:hypothetical protein